MWKNIKSDVSLRLDSIQKALKDGLQLEKDSRCFRELKHAWQKIRVLYVTTNTNDVYEQFKKL